MRAQTSTVLEAMRAHHGDPWLMALAAKRACPNHELWPVEVWDYLPSTFSRYCLELGFFRDKVSHAARAIVTRGFTVRDGGPIDHLYKPESGGLLLLPSKISSIRMAAIVWRPWQRAVSHVSPKALDEDELEFLHRVNFDTGGLLALDLLEDPFPGGKGKALSELLSEEEQAVEVA